LPALPDLPTFHEAGLTGYDYTCYHGYWFAAGVPAEIVRRMHAEIVKALQTPEVRDLLAKQGATAHAESPAEFTAFIKTERERIARVARQVGVTLD